MNEDLKQTKESFFKSGSSANAAKKYKSNVVPHYADEIASFEGSSSSIDDTTK